MNSNYRETDRSSDDRSTVSPSHPFFVSSQEDGIYTPAHFSAVGKKFSKIFCAQKT